MSSYLTPLFLAASIAGAQQLPNHRTATLDLTGGRHVLRGGLVDYRDGAMLDLFLAGAARSTLSSAIVVGGGASAILGGFGDRCLFKPDGGCAPQGNLLAFNVLSGIDVRLGGPSIRALVGPSIYKGAGATSLGLQGRLDLMTAAAFHTGLGLMSRVTVLPSHGGQSLVAWAFGASLIGR